jgi:hypothetical protein
MRNRTEFGLRGAPAPVKPRLHWVVAAILVWSSTHLAAETVTLVPKALCGPEDRVESVQGETTLAERFSQGPARAYNCNLELVGQFAGEGSSFGMNVFENWAYYSTCPKPKTTRPGVSVIDVTDPANPRLTAYLDTPAMHSANESLSISNTRRLLLAANIASTTFDIYDLSRDPGHPALITSASIPKMTSHSGEFAPDGRTFYSTACCGGVAVATVDGGSSTPPESAMFVINMDDPSHPHGITTWIPPDKRWLTHSVMLNKDGTRAYVALLRLLDDKAKAPNPNGLVVLDISEVQNRLHPPQIRIISTLFWDNTHLAQYAFPMTVKNKPYLVFTDLTGSIGWQASPAPVGVCNSTRPNFGFGRIIDISDEERPTTVSTLMLKVADPSVCSNVRLEPLVAYGYGSGACDVDDKENAKMLACSYYEGGLRVFDIRDPVHPTEIAYYKPPATRTAHHAGAPNLDFLPWSSDHTADQVMVPKFREHGRTIWFNSFDNGFQVVRFSPRFMKSRNELFRD